MYGWNEGREMAELTENEIWRVWVSAQGLWECSRDKSRSPDEMSHVGCFAEDFKLEQLTAAQIFTALCKLRQRGVVEFTVTRDDTIREPAFTLWWVQVDEQLAEVMTEYCQWMSTGLEMGFFAKPNGHHRVVRFPAEFAREYLDALND